jgi:hypothetical protein
MAICRLYYISTYISYTDVSASFEQRPHPIPHTNLLLISALWTLVKSSTLHRDYGAIWDGASNSHFHSYFTNPYNNMQTAFYTAVKSPFVFPDEYRVLFSVLLESYLEKSGRRYIGCKDLYSPTTMRVNSKPLLTDFLYTWFGRLAKPT